MSDIKIPEVKVPHNLGTGRRKTAVARVRLATGTGKIVINGRPFENYFPMESLRGVVTQPFTVTGSTDKFDAQITVTGGGPAGRLTRGPALLRSAAPAGLGDHRLQHPTRS